ncbi:MAG: hypothetical protein JWM09_22 [Francisellaceae bacterium]|nr:hypothetical protein [Francisellaceae bacterium]
MMKIKKWYLIFILLLSQCPLTEALIMTMSSPFPKIVFDTAVQEPNLPVNFRMTSDFNKNVSFNSIHLKALKASGSGQFSKKQLLNMLDNLPSKKIIIVDLRREYHGFVNDKPISWYANKNRYNLFSKDFNILREEQILIDNLLKFPNIKLHEVITKKEGEIIQSLSHNWPVLSAYTEISLVPLYGLGYKRFVVLDHHKPNDIIIDEFVSWIKQLPKDTWLHFHCRKGRGRSTTFLALYDIIKNANVLTIEEIVNRQYLLGGTDLFKIPTSKEKLWKKEPLIARAQFIKKFYEYVKDKEGYAKYPWSIWIRNQPKNNLFLVNQLDG